MHATVRSGGLPEEAIRRLVPGRPVQPWQWSPASYVLLEAERIGRESNWQEGRVEIEWINPQEYEGLLPPPHECLPGKYDDGPQGPDRVTCGNCDRAWCERCDPGRGCHWCQGRGYSTAPMAEETPEGMLPGNGASPSLPWPGRSEHFSPPEYTQAYVGASSVGWTETQLIAGFRPEEEQGEHGDYGSPPFIKYALSVLPPRWIPNVDHVTSHELRQAEDQAGRYPGLETRPPDYVDYSDMGSIKHPRDYEYFGGCCPDAYDPQSLLYAASRVVSVGRGRRGREGRTRRLVRTGPLLDVRLIKSVRIMTRKGRRWKNNPDERIRSRGRSGDDAGSLAARLRAGEADEPAARLLGALGYPPAAAVFDVTNPFPKSHQGFGPRGVAELALAVGPEAMIRLALENAQFFVNRFWGPPPCPSCDGVMEYDPGGVGHGHLVDPSWVCEHPEGLVALPAVRPEERAAPQQALDLIREVLWTIGQDVAGWDRGYADPPYRGGPLHRRVRDMIGFLSLSGGGEWATAFNFPAQGATVTLARYALQTLLPGPSLLSPDESRVRVLTYSLDEATVRLSHYAMTGTRGMGNVKAWRQFVTSQLFGWFRSVGRL